MARELYEDGRQARRRCDYRLATVALEEAIRLAMVASDWPLAVIVHAALGACASQRGNYRRARTILRDGRALAQRHGERPMEGALAHEQFLLATDLGEFAHARRLAREARELYGRRHPWLIRLCHDYGDYLIEQGDCARGRTLVHRAVQKFTIPEERMVAWGGIARASGALDDEASFRRALTQVAVLRQQSETRHHHAATYLGVARGALGLRRWRVAKRFARRALELATERREGKLMFEAESVAASAAARIQLEAGRGVRAAAPLADTLLSDMEGFAPGPDALVPI